MTNRTKWLMLITLSVVLTFVVWKYHGPSIARAMNIDADKIKLPRIALLTDATHGELTNLQWLDDVEIAAATCRQSGKPVLIYFTKGSDADCNTLSSEALHQEKVAAFLTERFVLARINIEDTDHKTAKKFGIHAVPAMVVYGPDGKHVDTLVGMPKVGKGEDETLETATLDWLKAAFGKSWGL